MAINWLLLRQFLRTDFDRLSFNFFEYLLLPLTAPEIHFAIIRKRDLQRRLLALRQLLLVLLHRRVLRRTIRCLPVLALSLLSLERLLHVTVPRDFQFESLLFSYAIWNLAIRFKRVEVQISKDKEQTTLRMMQKLKYLKWYDRIFSSSTAIF